jgi:hypothetical protein
MKKTILFIAFALTLALTTAHLNPTYAVEKEAGASATNFGTLLAYQPDTRAIRLKKFLQSWGSPMADDADTFVEEADKYDLDWKLVAAIAGTESTFGVHIPPGSYNAFGWGIPTGAQSGVGFRSWDDSISTVSEGLRKNYINKGAADLDAIGRRYAASPAWATHVRFFIDKIDAFENTNTVVLDLNI